MWVDVPRGTGGGGGVIFGAVIIQIGNYGRPIVIKLIPIIATADPAEFHAHVFGVFGDDGIVCGSISGRVVHLEV